MTTPYSQPTLSNFNDTPPPNDGTLVASNITDWNQVIDEVGTPLKTYAQAIDAAVLAAFAKLFGATLQGPSANDAVEAADQGAVFVCTNAITLSLLAVATAGTNFVFGVINANAATSGSLITVDPNGAETIDGLTTRTYGPGDGAIIFSSGSTWRSISLNRSHQHYFLASKSGTQAIATSTQTTITTWTETQDLASAFNATTGVFTVPTTGYYYFGWSVVMDDLGDGVFLVTNLLVDGSSTNVFGSRHAGGAVDDTISVGHFVFALTAGQTVALEVQHNHGSNRNVLTTTRFYGGRLG